MSERKGVETSFRRLKGWAGGLTDFVLALIPISGIVFMLHLSEFVKIPLFTQQYLGVVFGLVIAASFLLFPIRKGKALNRLPWYDFCFAILAIMSGLYVSVNYEILAVESGLITQERVLLGLIAVLLVLESSRRVVGLPFVIIMLPFLFYALFSSHFPGILGMRSIPFTSLVTFLYLDEQGIFGVPLNVSATIVLVFVLFGQVLSVIGGGKVFIDIAFSLMGRYRGGPAKVAVIASSLFGSISGSAVANVVTTGVFTIPLMKRSGYPPYFAGAVEAVASTGGQIMPPIMGAAAFLMATFLNIPYSEIAIAAIIPATLYYLAVFIQVDLRAAKLDLKGMPSEQIPNFWRVVLKGWTFVLPFLVLIGLLFFFGWEPESSGLITAGGSLALGLCFARHQGVTWTKALSVLRDTGRGLLEVGVTSAGAGIIIGVLSITGLGFIFSDMLVSLAGGNVFLLLLFAAIGASILGMGMTVTAAYLLMVVLIAPALVDSGIPGLIAHFFVFYYAILSFLTPPVCLAAYAAASLAGASMFKTALQSMKLGIAAYIIPFIFAYRPALLLQGSLFDIVEGAVSAIAGIYVISMGLEGYLFRSLSWPKRMIFFCGGGVMIIPGLIFDAVGIAIAIPLVVAEYVKRCSAAATT
jgi:TRAP transporter 4TM/12TM fusion protein